MNKVFSVMLLLCTLFICDVHKAQLVFAVPAQDISISLPKTVPDAVPFFLTVRTPVRGALSFTWLGRTRALSLGYDPKTKDYVAKAILAIPIDTPAQMHPIIIRVGNRRYSYNIQGTRRTYQTQNLNVNPSYVTPPATVLQQIDSDKRERNRIFAIVSERRFWTEKNWVRPTSGVQTSPFGARRVLNGMPRNPHQALDFRGNTGAPVYATAPGKVVFAGMQYYTGNTIYIDHGQGVLSGYAHLSAFDVRAGDFVNAGQLIGRIGSTGRSTGPHLHFTMYSYGIPFDPSGLVLRNAAR